jgi:thymidylate synthase (FAD)
MKVINAGFELLTPLDGATILKHIERIGRVCYKSEERITDESAPKFVKTLIERGHEAMIEHFSFSVKFVCDRGVSHEIVRHRVASFAQESTRYCNYSKEQFGEEITVIRPLFFEDNSDAFMEWYCGCHEVEKSYFALLKSGKSPQEARSVLPNSLKTEIVMTANLREWRTVLKLRACGLHGAPHHQMLEVMVPLLNELKLKIPVVFDDLIPIAR